MQHTDPSVGWDDPEYTSPPAGEAWSGSRQLVGAYLVFTVAASAVFLWSITVPGMRFLAGMVSLFALALVIVVWIVAAAVTLVRLLAGRTRRAGWFLLLVPLIGAVVLVLYLTDVPVRLAFEPSRGEFTVLAEQLLAAADSAAQDGATPDITDEDPQWDLVNPEVPERIGRFELWDTARVVPEGVLIFERNGAGFDDAGFAYLPEGRFPPGDGSFESPDFRSLGGGWYAFTSSW